MFPSSFATLIDFSPRRRARSRANPVRESAVLIRRAGARDEPEIARLAALDERELPCGDRLIAEVEGRAVAAVEVTSGATIADPFVPTSSIVELLGLRAAQVRR
jgi:hypothetical protein